MNTNNDQQRIHNNYGDSSAPGTLPKSRQDQEQATTATTVTHPPSSGTMAAPTATTRTTATPYSPPPPPAAAPSVPQGGSSHSSKDQRVQSPPKDPKDVAGTYRPDQQSPTSSSFTTTDASGYPDRQDGLSAYYSPPAVATVQDLNDHHKHHLVPGSISADPHLHARGQQAHQHPHSSNSSGDLSAVPVPVVDRPAVEVAELMGDTRLPEQTAVAHFLR